MLSPVVVRLPCRGYVGVLEVANFLISNSTASEK